LPGKTGPTDPLLPLAGSVPPEESKMFLKANEEPKQNGTSFVWGGLAGAVGILLIIAAVVAVRKRANQTLTDKTVLLTKA